MYYDDILESYLAVAAMESDYEIGAYEIATEADTQAATSTQTGAVARVQSAANKVANGIGDLGRKLIEAIQNALEFLQQQFATATTRLKNRAKKLVMSDEGYRRKLRERERSVKPLQGVKVTTYKYLDPWINTVTGKMRNEVMSALRELQQCSNPRNPSPPKNEILKVGTDKVIGELLKKVISSSDVTDIPSLFRYMQIQYRGKKSEQTYTQQQLPQLIKLAESHDGIAVQMNKYLTEAQVFHNAMKGYRNQMSSPNISDEQRKDFLTMLNKGTKIFNAYRSFLDYVYELRVEKSMNYRVIVQKFYQF